MNLNSLIKKLYEIDKPKSSAYLYEGLSESNVKSVFLWESAGKKLIEANLTTDQINQLFTDVEKAATDSGSNRTLLGKGKDAASAVNKAWEDLKTKVQNSGPIKNVDAMYDQAAEKLKQATGGDQGVMKYVQMYRDFAKKHPIAQSFIYAALIAAAGISGAGLGGAAALGLFKMTDKLLQGEKFSSAAYQGAKTGALAYGASKVGDYIKGKMAGDTQAPTGDAAGDQVVQRRGASSGDMKPGDYNRMSPVPKNPDGSLMTPQEINAAKDSLKVGSNAAGNVASAGVSAVRQQASDQALKAVQDAIANGTDPSMTRTLAGIAQGAIDKFGSAAGGPISQQSIETIAFKAAMLAQQGVKESTNLTSEQINLIFEHVSDSIILEGIWDSIKGAASKAANWAQTKGANLTNKVTADKLQQAWKAAGSPTDSEEVKKILQSSGVDAAIVDQAFSSITGNSSDQSAQSATQSNSTSTDQTTATEPAQADKSTTDANEPAQQNTAAGPLKAADIVKDLTDVWSKATADQGSETTAFPVQNQIRSMAKNAGMAGQKFESKYKDKSVVEFYSKFLNMKI